MHDNRLVSVSDIMSRIRFAFSFLKKKRFALIDFNLYKYSLGYFSSGVKL